MQIKVNKLQKTVDGDVQGANAVVIFLDKGNIVHEERFTGKTMGKNDHPFNQEVKWDGKYDKHEAVILDGGEFEYELVEGNEQEDAMDALTEQSEYLGLYKDEGVLASIVDMLHLSASDLKEGRTISSEELKSNLKDRSTKKNADK